VATQMVAAWLNAGEKRQWPQPRMVERQTADHKGVLDILTPAKRSALALTDRSGKLADACGEPAAAFLRSDCWRALASLAERFECRSD